MKSKLKGLIAVVAASSLVLAGCSRGEGEDTATGANGADSAEVGRVATMGLGDVDTVLALGITPVAIATIGAEGDSGPKGVGPWAEDELGDADPVQISGTGGGFTAEILEKLAATDPDQIIAVNSAADETAKKDLNEIAPTTFHPDQYADWQVPWDVQISTIAEALGKEDQGKELIEESKQAFADFRDNHPELQGKKAVAVMPYGGSLSLYAPGDGRADFLKELGFEFPEEITTDDGVFYKELSAENYSELDAADYVFILDYQGSAKELDDDSAFQNAAFTKEGKVVNLDTNTGNAMSMPNPLTIPWATDQIKLALS